jgi:hypothetical protein
MTEAKVDEIEAGGRPCLESPYLRFHPDGSSWMVRGCSIAPA